MANRFATWIRAMARKRKQAAPLLRPMPRPGRLLGGDELAQLIRALRAVERSTPDGKPRKEAGDDAAGAVRQRAAALREVLEYSNGYLANPRLVGEAKLLAGRGAVPTRQRGAA